MYSALKGGIKMINYRFSPHEVDIVKSYISNQNEHHLRTMFQDEYRGFLKKYQIEDDEKYVWD